MTSKSEVSNLIDYPCDLVAECDRCHDVKPLWEDTEEPGEFAYCAECWWEIAHELCLRNLQEGQRFRFADGTAVYTYRGNGWYGGQYDGGPWHRHDNPEVVLV